MAAVMTVSGLCTASLQVRPARQSTRCTVRSGATVDIDKRNAVLNSLLNVPHIRCHAGHPFELPLDCAARRRLHGPAYGPCLAPLSQAISELH